MRATLLVFLAGCRFGFEESRAASDAVPVVVVDADLSSPDGSERCPSGRGPAMSVTADGFCIDNTEVTKAQYQEFLDAALAVQTDGRCSFNTTYAAVGYVWNMTLDPAQALAGVDWCDARDYCAWAGKRLCGRIGGGSLAFTEHAAAGAQWYRACSQGGTRTHPYGTASSDAAMVGYCHLDDTNNATGQQAVPGAYPQCKLVGTNVVDLLGNVQEWTDACETTAADPTQDRCKVMGGVWYFAASYSDCDYFDPATSNGGVHRGQTEKHLGFRCCAD